MSKSDTLSDILGSVNTNLENVDNCVIFSIDLRKAFIYKKNENVLESYYSCPITALVLSLVLSRLQYCNSLLINSKLKLFYGLNRFIKSSIRLILILRGVTK